MLEDALEQTGIPLEEFENFTTERAKLGHVDDALFHLAARHALQVGIRKLVEIAEEGPREERFEVDGNTRITFRPVSTDLEAAKALVQFGLKARLAMLPALLPKPGKGDNGLQPDLWDLQSLGPWKELKDPSKL